MASSQCAHCILWRLSLQRRRKVVVSTLQSRRTWRWLDSCFCVILPIFSWSTAADLLLSEPKKKRKSWHSAKLQQCIPPKNEATWTSSIRSLLCTFLLHPVLKNLCWHSKAICSIMKPFYIRHHFESLHCFLRGYAFRIMVHFWGEKGDGKAAASRDRIWCVASVLDPPFTESLHPPILSTYALPDPLQKA